MSTKDDTGQGAMFAAEGKPPHYEADGGRHTFVLDPIRGFPELRWAGKRPFSSIAHYPAQLRETYAPEAAQRSEIYWGDNLQVMSHLLGKYRGRVGLVYLDPPFDSKADYKKSIRIRGMDASNDHGVFEEKQYTDIWNNDEYLQFMYERLILSRELLADNGNIVVHCDWRVSAALRLVLDEVFGPACFRNQMVWSYSVAARGAKAKAKQFAKNHDDLLWYSKSPSGWIYNTDFFERRYSEKEARSRGFRQDEKGRWFKTAPRGDYTDASIERLDAEGRIHRTRTGGVRIKYFLGSDGGFVTEKLPVGDVWTDIADAMHLPHAERTGYPTQKPEALLARLIRCLSNPGDTVADFFMGSGTTQAAAMPLGRRFLGCDINKGALDIATRRLSRALTQDGAQQEHGLDVYNVNNYEVFRNPAQAKELLVEALQLQPLHGNNLYDGEKDGRLVKIMPVNRLATRQDLNQLITNFNYKLFEKRKQEAPNQPVERLLIVCMGHEPDLKAHLQQEVPYKLDVEVVDILRDRADLEFKRDSEARVRLLDGELVVEAFYPMALLQKLSVMKEDVGEWRELVDSVLVDFNYDGAVMQPAVVDVPGRGDLVSGRYPVPEDAGTIRVRITDVLSESWEGEVQDG